MGYSPKNLIYGRLLGIWAFRYTGFSVVGLLGIWAFRYTGFSVVTPRGRTARERTARECTVRESTAREHTARDRAARERTARERTARERTARERTARERTARERTARERIASKEYVFQVCCPPAKAEIFPGEFGSPDYVKPSYNEYEYDDEYEYTDEDICGAPLQAAGDRCQTGKSCLLRSQCSNQGN
jgi:hypothetical protein